jgi:hypothetical protein
VLIVVEGGDESTLVGLGQSFEDFVDSSCILPRDKILVGLYFIIPKSFS